MNSVWIPPVSPYGLIQETLWPNEWRILVAGIFLNCTTRKQLERVWQPFCDLCPDPKTLLTIEPNLVAETIKSLGFMNRRTKSLFKMSEAYLEGSWQHAHELPGVGVYNGRSWEIFCQGIIGTEPPKDHALVQYWSFVRALNVSVQQQA